MPAGTFAIEHAFVLAAHQDAQQATDALIPEPRGEDFYLSTIAGALLAIAREPFRA